MSRAHALWRARLRRVRRPLPRCVRPRREHGSFVEVSEERQPCTSLAQVPLVVAAERHGGGLVAAHPSLADTQSHFVAGRIPFTKSSHGTHPLQLVPSACPVTPIGDPGTRQWPFADRVHSRGRGPAISQIPPLCGESSLVVILAISWPMLGRRRPKRHCREDAAPPVPSGAVTFRRRSRDILRYPSMAWPVGRSGRPSGSRISVSIPWTGCGRRRLSPRSRVLSAARQRRCGPRHVPPLGGAKMPEALSTSPCGRIP